MVTLHFSVSLDPIITILVSFEWKYNPKCNFLIKSWKYFYFDLIGQVQFFLCETQDRLLQNMKNKKAFHGVLYKKNANRKTLRKSRG